jgi:hypothetical protein
MASIHRTLFAVIFLLPLLVTAGCTGDDRTPTSPGAPGFTLGNAKISVDGTTYNDRTFRHGQGHGTSTRFEAKLLLADGSPAVGQEVWVTYRHGRGMMGSGRFRLHDDGTQCDHPPGSGMYCYEDHHGRYGFHHDGAHHGTYRYQFRGHHRDGRMSNQVEVSVEVGR